jgi:hypothetical protein
MDCFSKHFGMPPMIVDYQEYHFEVVDFILSFSFVKAVEFNFGFLKDPSLVGLVGLSFIRWHLDHLDLRLSF